MKALQSLLALAVVIVAVTIGWRAFSDKPPVPSVPAQNLMAAKPVSGSSPDEISVLSAQSGQGLAEIARADQPVRESSASLSAQIELALKSEDEAEWERVLNRLYPALVAQDRLAAAQILENMSPGDRRIQLLRRLARAWAPADFAGAVDWIGTMKSATDQKIAFEDACFGEAESNPAEAVRAWEIFNFGVDDYVLANLVQNWAVKDLRAAQAWATARAPGPPRDQAVARIAYVMVLSTPADAAALVVREIPPGSAQTEAVISVLHRWAQRDLTGATAWAAGFPEGALRDRAVGELAGIGRGNKGGAGP